MKTAPKFVAFLLIALIQTSAALPYNPPVGIPDPAAEWGGLHPIDAPKPDRAEVAPGWHETPPRPNSQAAGDSWDCYYVDRYHPAATDSGNDYGFPGKPRLTPPSKTYNPKSYLEIHGSVDPNAPPYATKVTPCIKGTPDSPLWIIGVNNPVISNKFDHGAMNFPETCYIIVDGIRFASGGKIEIRPRFAGNKIHHIAYRNCVQHGGGVSNGSGIGINASISDEDRYVENIVFHKCNVSHNGDKNDPREEMGFSITERARKIFILDCRVHDNAEDAIQAGHASRRFTTDLFIGRCALYNNITNGCDLKGVGRAVLSECDVYGHFDVTVDGEHKSTGAGEGLVFHYANSSTGPGSGDNYPEDISLLCSTVSDGIIGLATSRCGRLRVAGCVFRRNDRLPTFYTPSQTAAIWIRGLKDDTWISHNTFHGYDGGIRIDDGVSSFSDASLYFRGYNVTESGENYVCIKDDDVGITGVPPSNSTYWRKIRLQVVGNILHSRTRSENADINISSSVLANASFDFAKNNFFHPEGPMFFFGGNTPRTLAWVSQNASIFRDSIAVDPLFVNAASDDAGDYRLRSNSPAIDRSTPGVSTATARPDVYADYQTRYGLNIRFDRNGVARPQGTGWDLGAYEYQGGAGGDQGIQQSTTSGLRIARP